MAYVKLDTGILDSTLWLSSPDTRVVFITMLAMAHPDGMVEATAPGIARRANMEIDRVRSALGELESPDPDSRTMADDGRRIKRVDGGYEITNYTLYREKDHTAKERMRRMRERRNNRNGETVLRRNGRNESGDVTQAEAEAEAEAQAGVSSPDGEDGDAKAPPSCPHQKIIDLYREICVPVGMPDVKVWNNQRERLLRARWREAVKHQSLDFWRQYFEHVAASHFLTGQAEPKNGQPPFCADLEWIVRPTNFAKIVEGKYHRG